MPRQARDKRHKTEQKTALCVRASYIPVDALTVLLKNDFRVKFLFFLVTVLEASGKGASNPSPPPKCSSSLLCVEVVAVEADAADAVEVGLEPELAAAELAEPDAESELGRVDVLNSFCFPIVSRGCLQLLHCGRYKYPISLRPSP